MSFITLTNLLMKNKIVVYKSDTIPSIYARLSCYDKVANIKKRNNNKPFILLVDSLHMIKKYTKINNWDYIKKIALQPFTTIIYSSNDLLKNSLFWKFDTVAMRIPHLINLRKVMKEIKEPIISTSYNDKCDNKNNLYFLEGWDENSNGKPSRIFDLKKKEYIR